MQSARIMTSSRIPPLLKPYLSLPPPASLTLLTDVLGATHNWLLVRFLAAALASADGRQWEGAAGATVVLVSFLRNRDFWKLEASRVVCGMSSSAILFAREEVSVMLSRTKLTMDHEGPRSPWP